MVDNAPADGRGGYASAQPQTFAPAEQEVAQGDLFDFCYFHSQQDDAQEEWHEEFGFEESPHKQYVRAINEAMETVGSRLEFQDDGCEEGRLPYGMTQEQHEDYKVQLEVFKKSEKAPEEKVEIHHVEKAHQHVEYAKAGRLEKDLLHSREDQLERRLAMLERIASAAPNRPKQSLYGEEELQQHPEWRQEISPFVEKFLPVPLGGGKNWHYFNSSQGFYIERNKIAQREAQLKHMERDHHHRHLCMLAGKKLEEVPEEYWERDHRSWLKEVTKPKERRGGQFGAMMNPFG